MTPIAITMLIVSVLTLWGGLLAAVVHLKRAPERVVDEGDD